MRRSTLGALLGATLVVTAFATPAATAASADRPAPTPQQVVQSPGLPPVGSEVHSRLSARGVPFVLRGKTHLLDFEGGIIQVVETHPTDPLKSVRMRTIGLRMKADLDGGGSVVLEQAKVDADVDAVGDLTVTGKLPLELTHRVRVRLRATVDLGGDVRASASDVNATSEPLVLMTKDPAKLIGKLTQFPPRGELYQLPNPVELVPPDDPTTTIAIIERFPVKVGGL